MLFGVLTPICISTQNMLAKHMTGKDIRFDPNTLSFSSYLLVNSFVMIFAIIYWVKTDSFEPRLFWMGLAGSIVNTLGLVCVQNAVICGPAGPASALANSGNIFLTIIEAVKNEKIPKWPEIIGLVIGTLGAMIIVVPKWFEKPFRAVF